jgi:hypothetical protein
MEWLCGAPPERYEKNITVKEREGKYGIQKK